MKKIIGLFLLCINAAGISFAQDPFLQWQAKPVVHQVSDQFKNSSAVVLEDYRLHEYKFNEKKEMYVYCQQRKLIKVQDDNGVTMYNKIYISTGATSEVLDVKARCIQKDGKVVDLPASKILDVEEEGSQYKKFAMEGVEKGSEIEYYYVIKYPLFTFGIQTFSLSETPVEKARFCLKVPEHLQFNVKGYNGVAVSGDTVLNNTRITYASADRIDFFEGEKYANPKPYHSNVQYKLSYNLDKDKNTRMNTWSQLAKNVYNNYSTFSSKEEKAIENYFKKISFPSSAKDGDKIYLIEDYVKSNISIREETISDDDNSIEKIIKTKVSGHNGVIRLLIGLYAEAGIPATIVFPSKRNDMPIDEEFENYRLIDDMLLYFSATGNFIDPVNVGLRYPIIDAEWGGTRGLFIKETSIGNLKSALAVFDSIPLQPYESNSSNLDVHLSFNSSVDTLLIKSKQILTGYSAANYRPVYTFLEKQKQDEFTKDIIKNVAVSDIISNIRVENPSMLDGYKNLPLNIIGDIKAVDLLEDAGNNKLVKIGAVIGQQVQMYQETQRKLPITINYPHALDRKIVFIIPENYRVRNLDDINIHVTDKDKNGVETMGFISSYVLKDRELTINLHEFYKSISYDTDKIEIFRKVINAAADFNKITLVLERTM